ncbi:MAG TPA: hypothetical protein VN644_22560 [Pyrinomonadaceae bacterium]|nr:hypothetical protein [Pyrinomonadaceae bacterium]
MKNQIYRIAAILGIFLGLAVAGVQAQTPSRVEVNIPFEFSAGKTTLKAGVYTVKRMSGNLVTLRNVADKSSVILNAPVNLSSTNVDATERLVFNKQGERYLLAQIWLTVDSGRELLKEKKSEKGERIEVALRVSQHVE